jgi:hypothetical protein
MAGATLQEVLDWGYGWPLVITVTSYRYGGIANGDYCSQSSPACTAPSPQPYCMLAPALIPPLFHSMPTSNYMVAQETEGQANLTTENSASWEVWMAISVE